MIATRIALPHACSPSSRCALRARPGPGRAGGLTLYEVGTADVGLASAGYNRARRTPRPCSPIPPGMTQLEGTQALLGAQLLYGDVKF